MESADMTIPTTRFLRTGTEAQVAAEAQMAWTCQDLLADIRVWPQRWRTRRQLRDLDARLMADAGISAEAGRHEGAKWFWQA
jgi:uncharacterized protein YjiS (DUF1127 family)